MDDNEIKKLHNEIGFAGFRAHATAIGLIQLTSELIDAGVLDKEALERIKTKIAQDLALNAPPRSTRKRFEAETKQRLDRLFSGEERLEPSGTVPGSEER